MVKIKNKLDEIVSSFSTPNAALRQTALVNYKLPIYSEITDMEQLADINSIVYDLKKIDWSFTEDKTNFLTHNLHPYPAKFIPQIPGHLIARLSLRGETVLDPFGGSGTTALEAIRLGRRAISVDANPIGILMGKVKTSVINKSTTTELQKIRCYLRSNIDTLPKNPNDLCLKYKKNIPLIPNIDKWFPLSSRGELALIKEKINNLQDDTAKNISNLALSKILLAVSYQDSETRYTSRLKDISIGDTIHKFILALDSIIDNLLITQAELGQGKADFIVSDIKHIQKKVIEDDSVDLLVTSPPYGNAMDYHLYHRFRLFWLGYDPKEFAKIEIGSHLRHQKESTGFEEYLSEMKEVLKVFYRVLKPGRFAILVIGDSVYKNKKYSGAESLALAAEKLGFEVICTIDRKLHKTKRSFASVARRANSEKILVIRKPPKNISVILDRPKYKLWGYEEKLRFREINSLITPIKWKDDNTILISPYKIHNLKKLVFTSSFTINGHSKEKCWQTLLENGLADNLNFKKEPKYLTHGLHQYKGKFYPQLAKALLNLKNLPLGSKILDPFCGSGTTLLEGYLNGYQCYGFDMNPLAAEISKAKVGILSINTEVFKETIGTLVDIINDYHHDKGDSEQFSGDCIDEIERWFPKPVIAKINYLLRAIRELSNGIMREFLEVTLSSIIREVSQQDPNDLRIRIRKEKIKDADVFLLFLQALNKQYAHILKFWNSKRYAPNTFLSPKSLCADSRLWKSFSDLKLKKNTVDLILTSPPYATALPYIDTDRLSLLTIYGISSTSRRPLEMDLIGSREIKLSIKRELEARIRNESTIMPYDVTNYLNTLLKQLMKTDSGFRRMNMPSLLLRFFIDMERVLGNCYKVLKPGGSAMFVIGDNKIKINNQFATIPTTDLIEKIANSIGFTTEEKIDITVTTENYLHIKNSITKNIVLCLKKNI